MSENLEKNGAGTGPANETKPEEGKGPFRAKEKEGADAKAEVVRLTKVLADAEAKAKADMAATIAAFEKRLALLAEDNETLEGQRDDAWLAREKAYAEGCGLKEAELKAAAKELNDVQRALAEMREKYNDLKTAYFRIEARLKKAEEALDSAIEKPRWMFWGPTGIRIQDGPEA